MSPPRICFLAFDSCMCGPVNLSRPEVLSAATMDDAEQQYLAELRLKARRIAGNKTLSAKQVESLRRIVQEVARIEGAPTI